MRKPTAVDSNDANVNEALTDTAQAAEASVVKGGSQDEGDRRVRCTSAVSNPASY